MIIYFNECPVVTKYTAENFGMCSIYVLYDGGEVSSRSGFGIASWANIMTLLVKFAPRARV